VEAGKEQAKPGHRKYSIEKARKERACGW